MKLYLGSCDLGTNQEELRNWIKRYGKDIILIPNALDTIYNEAVKQNMINEDKRMLESVGFDVRVETLEDYFGNYSKLKESFDKYKAFYAIGGNVFTLRKAMELSGFDRYLKELADKEDRSYIVTQSLKKIKGHLKEWALSRDGWHRLNSKKEINLESIDNSSSNEEIYYKERWINEDGLSQRLIVSYSPKYAAYQKHIRMKQIEQAQNLISNPTKISKNKQNDPKRFIKSASITNDGEIANKKIFTLNQETIKNEEAFDGFYAVCTTLEDDISEIIKVNKRRWEIEESFRILKSDFKARPVYLKRDDRIKAHFTTCFLSLLIYRILEHKLEEKYTSEQIITTLRKMNFLKKERSGYIPTYTRTDLTDSLHKVFGFRTDTEIVPEKEIKKILTKTKK